MGGAGDNVGVGHGAFVLACYYKTGDKERALAALNRLFLLRPIYLETWGGIRTSVVFVVMM